MAISWEQLVSPSGYKLFLTEKSPAQRGFIFLTID